MPTQKKADQVEKWAETLSRSTVALGTEYRGLKVHEITALRRTLREAGVEMHVIKNTLFRRAARPVSSTASPKFLLLPEP